ncbi:hypothetical protein [Modestobacter sp. URMC 112]
MTSDELPPELQAALDQARERPWPGPDLYTLRAWVELDSALDSGVPLDAAHAVLTDGAERAFGPRLHEWVTGALAAEQRDPEDLAVLLADDALAERVLQHVRDRMRDDDRAPDPPSEELGWYAYAPGDPAGARERFRRAVRSRRRTARDALLAPRRRRVAGPRDR